MTLDPWARKLDMTSRHDYVDNAWRSGSCHGYKVILLWFPQVCSSMLQVGGKPSTQSYSCNNIYTLQWWMCDHTSKWILVITTPSLGARSSHAEGGSGSETTQLHEHRWWFLGLCCLQFLGSHPGSAAYAYTLCETLSVVIRMLWHQVGRGYTHT